MNLLNVLHKSPEFINTLAFSAYGLYNRRIRYGNRFHAYLNSLNQSQWLPEERIHQIQNDQFVRLVQFVGARTEYYKTIVRDLKPRQLHIGLLKAFPIITKEELRKNAEQFLSDGFRKSDLVEEHTSGTTGMPMRIVHSKESIQFNYAVAMSRSWQWANLNLGDKRIMFGGRLIVPVERGKKPFWVENKAERQLYFSTVHLSKDYLPYYVEKIMQYNPVFMTGYTSAIYILAKFIRETLKARIPLKAVLPSSETLFAHQREIMEDVFNCKVYDGYSSTEYVCYVSECGKGNLHISPEAGIIELLDEEGHDVRDGETGEIVATTLFNYPMPLIRYRTGDLAIRKSGKCPCGRELPMLRAIIGRKDDIIRTSDGRLIGRLDPVFKGLDGILECQIVQEKYDVYVLNLVPAPGYSESIAGRLVHNLKGRIGEDITVRIRLLEKIPRERSGKFRTVVSRLGND